MLSYWEQTSFINYDYIIAGSGIVGLSTAISLKEQQPKAKIAILERGIFPTGASTKNAGFACIGSLTEILADLKTNPTEQVTTILEMRHNGLKKLRKRLGDNNIGYQNNGSYELINQQQLHLLNKLDEINQLLKPILKRNPFQHANNNIKTFGFNQQHVKAMIKNNFEGQLDTGKLMTTLLQYAQKKGINIINGANITHFEEQNQNNINITIQQNNPTTQITFNAKKLIICTNAFTKNLINNIDLYPGRGQVLITNKIPNLKWKGIFHFDEGYYYFRNVENRILFGGGRNLDFQTETTTTFDTNQKIITKLTQLLKEIIIPNQNFSIDMTWSGIMAFGPQKMPYIAQHSPTIIYGVKLSGMGIAIGTIVGEMLAQLTLNN